MKLTQLIDEIREASPDADQAQVARLTIDAVLASADPADLMFPAVHGYIITLDRTRVRSNERNAPPFRDKPKPRPAPTPSANDAAGRQKDYTKPGSDEDPAVAARRALLRNKVYVPDKGYIEWGKLTVEDFDARIAHLEQRIQGINESIARLVEARDLLRRSGSKNLDDYYSE